MSRFRLGRQSPLAGLALAAMLCGGSMASATTLLMKDGRVLTGRKGEVAGLAEAPVEVAADSEKLMLIVFLDDDLRRIFVPRRQIAQVLPDPPATAEQRFQIRQPQPRNGMMVRSVGPLLKTTPFDAFGRRTVTMGTSQGQTHIIQGITKITPQWIKIEGITLAWDQRIATNSVPRDQLHKILMKQVDREASEDRQVEQRMGIATFYLQCERYEEAMAELQSLSNDFPRNTQVANKVPRVIHDVRQMAAKRLISEMKLRRGAGQHALVLELLQKFPSKGIDGEILQEVREMIQQYEALLARRAAVVKQFNDLLAQVKSPTRQLIQPIGKEIAEELTIDTLARMAVFLQAADDPQMKPEEKLALAASGWLLGSNAATQQLSQALSTQRLRDLTVRYMNEPTKAKRARLLEELPSEEHASPKVLAALLAHMKPPIELPEPISTDRPGYYKLEAAGLPKEPPVQYYIQLPPGYNPYRRYPMIVTLHGEGSSGEMQIDWWAGAWTSGVRAGQATRQGYIVLAPQWAGDHQHQYGYSAREHAAVLYSLRDACRRFAVDTDRVFLSGHSMGGDAAWDMALAHPDLWAGAIPIVAESDRYCIHYRENAQKLPLCFVAGQLDGTKMVKNARELNRYFTHGYNVTVVEYQGRGHEHFSDELLRLFDWMGRFRREFYPREFTCYTLRVFDNFFWWVEVQGMPAAVMIDPARWAPPRSTARFSVAGTIAVNNNILVRTGKASVTLWLSPQVFDFQARPGPSVTVNGRPVNNIRPSLEVMLEDVRTRGDRQHPFWAKVEVH